MGCYATVPETHSWPLFDSVLWSAETLFLTLSRNSKAIWLYNLHSSRKPFSIFVPLPYTAGSLNNMCIVLSVGTIFFLVIPLTCILYLLNANVLVWVTEFILSLYLLCAVLIYHRYKNANIGPWWLNIFPTSKHFNTWYRFLKKWHKYLLLMLNIKHYPESEREQVKWLTEIVL